MVEFSRRRGTTARHEPWPLNFGPAKSGITRNEGIGYGDSYVMDPRGEILARSQRQVEDIVVCDVDLTVKPDMAWGLTKSAWSYREFHTLVEQAMKG